MNEVKVYSGNTEEDNRRYAYEKAIEAYWKHVDRYHTWMNSYAIFNGALFVGFCSLLTATTEIQLEKSLNKQDVLIFLADIKYNISLGNSYYYLLSIICILGLISSILWLYSLHGHVTWMNNWMNIIQKYEDGIYRVYKTIVASTEELKEIKSNNNIDVIKDNKSIYKAYSTTKITKIFIISIIVGWFLTFLYITCVEMINPLTKTPFAFLIFIISIIAIIIFVIIISYIAFSDMKGKVIVKYDNINTIIYK